MYVHKGKLAICNKYWGISAGNVLSAATKLTHYWLSTYLEHVDADHSRTPINYTFSITGLHNIK